MKKKIRVDYFDIARGITILLVILGHCLPKDSISRQLIYTFHMPLFFLISGYFFKEKEMGAEIKSCNRSLLKPYLISSMFIMIFFVTKAFIKGQDAQNQIKYWGKAILFGSGEITTFLSFKVPIIGTLWFLLSLYWVKVIFNLIYKCKNNIITMSFIVVIAIIGFIIPKYIWLPFSIDTSLINIIFYYIGFIFNKYNVFDKKLSVFYYLILFAIWLILGLCCKTYSVSNEYNYYIVNIFEAVIGCYLIIMISKFIINCNHILSNILKWIGKNSLYIMCFHAIEGRGIIPWSHFIKNNSIIIIIAERMLFALIMTISLYCMRRVRGIIIERK